MIFALRGALCCRAAAQQSERSLASLLATVEGVGVPQQPQPGVLHSGGAEHASSGSYASSSGLGAWQQQARRSYSKKGGSPGGRGGAPPKAAGGNAAVTAGADDYSPPTFRAALPSKADPLQELPASQRAFLQALVPSGAKLRSPRQLGWDLGPHQTLALLHQTMAETAGAPVLFTPFVVSDLFQSANTVAEWVKLVIESGEDFSVMERFFVQVLAAEPRPNIKGLRVQIKGRLAGKGGKASKKVWQTGATSVAKLSDPVDFAKAAAETTAGLIGVKVWLVFKPGSVAQGSYTDTRLVSPHRLADVLTMRRTAAVKASSSAWWAAPGPLQPAHVGARAPYKAGFDAVVAFSGANRGAGSGGAAAAAAAEQEEG